MKQEQSGRWWPGIPVMPSRFQLHGLQIHIPEKKWARKPRLETVLSDLNSTRILLFCEVMTSGISEPQNLPCSLASGDRPLRTSTKSYLQTCEGIRETVHPHPEPLLRAAPCVCWGNSRQPRGRKGLLGPHPAGHEGSGKEPKEVPLLGLSTRGPKPAFP